MREATLVLAHWIITGPYSPSITDKNPVKSRRKSSSTRLGALDSSHQTPKQSISTTTSGSFETR
jgi:hypothetical protein